MSLLIGLDLGTTAVKAGVFDEKGSLLSLGSAPYRLLTPGPGLVELPGVEYKRAVSSALRQAVNTLQQPREEIAALCICSQGETFVPIDRDGRELRDFIVWLDARAVSESEELRSKLDPRDLYHRTGLPGIDPAFDLPKLLWLSRREPSIFDRTSKFLHLADYITWHLTGEFASNDSICSTTGYMDIRTRDWWDDALSMVGADRKQFAPVVTSGDVAGKLLGDVAEETGLPQGIPVVCGPMDQAAGAIGAGNLTQGILTETTGGALATVSSTDAPVYDPQCRVPVGIHGVPGKYSILTYNPTGGLVLGWLRDLLGESEYGSMTKLAGDISPGSDGVVFLPHLAGMVLPRLDADARGAIVGLSLGHGKGHLTRAALEAVAFMLREHLELIGEMGVGVRTIRSLGGGARSDLWLQIKADVAGIPVETTACPEAACLGAALIAGTSVGVWSSLDEAVEAAVRMDRRFEPDQCHVDAYHHHYQRYCDLSLRFYG